MPTFTTLTRSRRTPTLIQVRLWAGLALGAFVTTHLANHAFGLVGVEAQEAARPYFMWFWHTLAGQVLLYGSLLVHAWLGLYALVRRRHYRVPPWERAQVALGLAVPYLLLAHILATRGTRVLTGIDIDYLYENVALWPDPWVRARQAALVLLVWGHFAVGLHFWLRNRAGYRRAFPLALVLYVLVPLAALLGFAGAGRQVAARAAADPAWHARMKTLGVPADPARARLRATLRTWAGPAWLGLVGAALVYVLARRLWARGRTFTVTYPQGDRVLAPVGMSILEVSRMAGRPHMAVCGGRARCTTCRVAVLAGGADLPPPGPDERRALERVSAPPGLRLACQTRPTADVEVQPLLKPDLATAGGTGGWLDRRGGPEFGQEREVTVLFIDIRGSTKLAEKRLPFDVVFLLNHFFEEMAEAVEQSGGHYSNFTGDGLMALFGLQPGPDPGARPAMACAASMLERMDRINERLAEEMESPLSVGIGIHTGLAIVGRMGPPKAPFVTALGDTVNTASRLEGLTKELGAPVVLSVDTLDAAGMPHPRLHQAEIRGRSTRLAVAALDVDGVRELLWTPLPPALKASKPASRGGAAVS